MAGNESDLLKQATQAMMARYDGKPQHPLCLRGIGIYEHNFALHTSLRCYNCENAIPHLYFARTVVGCWFGSLLQCLDVYRTCLKSKLTRGKLIEAVIGRAVTGCFQTGAENRPWLFFLCEYAWRKIFFDYQ
jgi:hypothetical protein